MYQIIEKSNKHYYRIENGKKYRISKDKYLEMKKYHIGGYNLTKKDMIKKVYNHLIKNKLIRNENKLENDAKRAEIRPKINQKCGQ